MSFLMPAFVEAAKRATVPVVVHFDHGVSFDKCMEALKLGASSVMFDGSMESEEINLQNTREMVKIAHSLGATVEGEIGHVGQAASGIMKRMICIQRPKKQFPLLKEQVWMHWLLQSVRRMVHIRKRQSLILKDLAKFVHSLTLHSFFMGEADLAMTIL